MEENNNVVTNLSSLVNNDTLVVDDTVSPYTEDTIVDNTSSQVTNDQDEVKVETSSNEVVSNEVNEVQEEIKKELAEDEISVNVKVFQQIIAQVKKAAICESIKPITQVIYLKFSDSGLYVAGNNSSEIVSVLDTSKKYDKTLEISVEADTFSKLISQLDSDSNKEEVILKFKPGVLEVRTETGTFFFTEKIDPSTNETIKIENTTLEQSQLVDFDFKSFSDSLVLGKAIRSLAVPGLKGIFLSDLLVSSDTTLMTLQKSPINVYDANLYMGSSFVELLENITLEDKCKLGFIKNGDNEIKYLYITDDKTTIAGPLQENTIIPIDTIKNFWTDKFANRIVVDRAKLVKILKRITLFINTMTDLDYAKFNIENNVLTVESNSSAGSEKIIIENTNNYTGKLNVPIVKVLKLLDSITLDKVNIDIGDNNALMCLSAEDYKCIISLAD